MRCLLTALAITVAAAEAVALDPSKDDGRSNQAKDAAAKQPAAANSSSSQPRVRSGVTLWYYPYYGYYAFPYGPVPNGYVWYGPGYYYPRRDWPWALPPVYVAPGSLYGPDAVRRFMGADRGDGAAAGADANRAKEAPPIARGTNAESVALGRRFMHLGDEYFRAGRYSLAYERYRGASQAAPRLGEIYFRQGFALAALGRYDAAAREFKRGLELDPNWPRSGFRLADLYRDKTKAKTAHMEAMAKAADTKFETSDLLFVIGLYLHFDGQTERAKPFFQRAAQLAGGSAAHLEAFLGAPHTAGP